MDSPSSVTPASHTSVVEADDDVFDPEQDFVDAEANPGNGHSPELDANLAVADTQEDEISSVESFDSAQERIALASAVDAASTLDSSSRAAATPQFDSLSSNTVAPEEVGMLKEDTGTEVSQYQEMHHEKPEADSSLALNPTEEHGEDSKWQETNFTSRSGDKEAAQNLEEDRDTSSMNVTLSSFATEEVVEDHGEEHEVSNMYASQTVDAREVSTVNLEDKDVPIVKASTDMDEEVKASPNLDEEVKDSRDMEEEVKASPDMDEKDLTDDHEKDVQVPKINGVQSIGATVDHSEDIIECDNIPVETGKVSNASDEPEVQCDDVHEETELMDSDPFSGSESNGTRTAEIESVNESDKNKTWSQISVDYESKGQITVEKSEVHPSVEPLLELTTGGVEQVSEITCSGTEDSSESVHLDDDNASEIPGENATIKNSSEVNEMEEDEPLEDGNGVGILQRELLVQVKESLAGTLEEEQAGQEYESTEEMKESSRAELPPEEVVEQEEITERNEEHPEANGECEHLKSVADTKLDVSVREYEKSAEEKSEEEILIVNEENKNVVSTSTASAEKKEYEVNQKNEAGKTDTPENVVEMKAAKSEAPSSSSTAKAFVAEPSSRSQPAGLGASIPSLEITSRGSQRGSSTATRQTAVSSEENSEASENNDDSKEKLHMIRVKFLRLAHRLGQSDRNDRSNVVVAQVLYRLGLAEQLRGGRASGRTGSFSLERANALAEEQEAAGLDDLDFECTIMVLGKSGVGKSATINSLFDEVKSPTNAYCPATNKVQEIIGTIHGIKLRVIDTPGLLTSFADQPRNRRIMSSVKRLIKKSPPDIVLYFDRLDIPSRDYGDLPLLRTITETFGAAVWFNAIVVLTHASSAPPDGANGAPVSYEMFVAQRSHIVQQTIRQAAGDMRLMNPVSLVENHDACRRNRAGQRVLPNGQVWQSQLLLLCFASKILAEANSLLKLQDSSPTKPLGVRSRVPPLPFLLSSLLQSRASLQLPDEQTGGDDDDEDTDDDESDSDGEEDYDDLPPFRRLTKDELKLLDKEQRQIYFDELDYREKLFVKKQLKEERLRKKEMKRRLASETREMPGYVEENLEDENSSAAVPVPMPDMALPPSFDSDNPTYRYRYLDTPNQFLVRPVLETHGWDHDSGYDGINVERMFVISKKIPASVSGQITKDKKEASLQMECSASFKNGEGKSTQAGLDVQTIGKDLAYTLRSETKFNNLKRNKTTCGLSVTILGDTMAAGMKIENQKMFGKRAKLVLNGGAITGRTDVAYGGSLEASLRDKDYPVGQFMSNLGLSVMNWHGDLAIGGNLQMQFKAGKATFITRGNLNNRGAGQISIRASSSEQLQMALIGLIPLLRSLLNSSSVFPGLEAG